MESLGWRGDPALAPMEEGLRLSSSPLPRQAEGGLSPACACSGEDFGPGPGPGTLVNFRSRPSRAYSPEAMGRGGRRRPPTLAGDSVQRPHSGRGKVVLTKGCHDSASEIGPLAPQDAHFTRQRRLIRAAATRRLPGGWQKPCDGYRQEIGVPVHKRGTGLV